MSRGMHYAISDEQAAPFLEAAGDEDKLNQLLFGIQDLVKKELGCSHYTPDTYHGLACFLAQTGRGLEDSPWRSLAFGERFLVHGETLLLAYTSPAVVSAMAETLVEEMRDASFGAVSDEVMKAWGLDELRRVWYLECLEELTLYFTEVAARGDHLILHIY